MTHSAEESVHAGMRELRLKRAAEAAQPWAIVGRLGVLITALRMAETAEEAVVFPTDHPKWREFCECLGEVDFGQLRQRLEKMADAWQAEIDAEPEA